MPTYIISGRKFSYSLTRKFISSIRLRLISSKSFAISAPHFTPQIIIDKFISDHSSWILKNLPSPKIFPQSLTILDKKYQIIITKTSRDSANLFEDEQKIYLNSSITSKTHLRQLLDKKLRPHALKLINLELKALRSLYNFEFNQVSIRNQSSRFGSCSSTGNLSFNWQIILFPTDIFRHIILHELTHTIHPDHSHRFWSQLAKFDPQFITHRYWLKKQASKHMIFS